MQRAHRHARFESIQAPCRQAYPLGSNDSAMLARLLIVGALQVGKSIIEFFGNIRTRGYEWA